MRWGPLRVGVVSAYPPRRDAFAEDAQDLVRALAAECEVAVCAVGRPGLNYPNEVVVAAGLDEIADYRRAGRVLVEHGVEAVLIRHSDGMYGGPHGAHILDLSQELRRHGIPRVVDVLTVRSDAPASWNRTVAALTADASAVLVPSPPARSVALARRIASADQLRVVGFGVPAAVLAAARGSTVGLPGPVAGSAPVGAPTVPATLADALRDAGPVIATVRICGQGGLGPIVAAVRELVDVRPTVRLVVVRLGRAADEIDERLVEAYGLTEQVRIIDAHVPAADFAALLVRAGAYVSLGDDPDLPRAIGAGCPTLVVPDNTTTAAAAELARALAAALDDPVSHDRARYAAAQAGPGLGWPAAAHQHAEVLRASKPAAPAPVAMPALRLDWLDRDLGRLRSFEPDRDARLAAVAAGLLSLPDDVLSPATRRVAAGWAGRTVRALGVAVQVGPAVAGGARAVWGLGALAAGAGVPATLRRRAAVLRALLAAPWAAPLLAARPSQLRGSTAGTAPKDLPGNADVVLGLYADRDLGGAEWHALCQAAAQVDCARQGRREWPVFAERLSSDDIRLAHALVAGGGRLDDQAMVDRGLETIDWLAQRAGLTPTADGVWRPPTAGPPTAIEAGGWVEALSAAYATTGLAPYARMAQQTMLWFLGGNLSADAVLDSEVGACRVGLGPSAAMMNLSTAATLAYLGAALSLHASGLVTLPLAEVSRQDLATVA